MGNKGNMAGNSKVCMEIKSKINYDSTFLDVRLHKPNKQVQVHN